MKIRSPGGVLGIYSNPLLINQATVFIPIQTITSNALLSTHVFLLAQRTTNLKTAVQEATILPASADRGNTRRMLRRSVQTHTVLVSAYPFSRPAVY